MSLGVTRRLSLQMLRAGVVSLDLKSLSEKNYP